jgi:hypothetical protein
MTDIQDGRETIWYPGPDYIGRQDELHQRHVSQVSEETLVDLVQLRAVEDGEWAIENGLVGDNDELMRRMMEWVGMKTNIIQCKQANLDMNPTVDMICRELADVSKSIARGDVRG